MIAESSFEIHTKKTLHLQRKLNKVKNLSFIFKFLSQEKGKEKKERNFI